MLNRVATFTATNPDHAFVLIGLNDHFNHNGTPIPPATSATNVTAWMAAVKVARPNIRFHFIENLWYGTEARPDGSGPDDAAVVATNAAERTAVLAEPQAEWMPIRLRIYTVDSPAYNPTNLTLGAMTQDGYHPTITAGQQAISNEVYALTSFGI